MNTRLHVFLQLGPIVMLPRNLRVALKLMDATEHDGWFAVPAAHENVGCSQWLPEVALDSYKFQHWAPEPAACPDCGAIFRAGRWQWGERPRDCHDAICPACHRIRDHSPAAVVEIDGFFLVDHRQEVISLIRDHAFRIRAERPMARILYIWNTDDGLVVPTTDIHLARVLGETLNDAYCGHLELLCSEADDVLRVHWHR